MRWFLVGLIAVTLTLMALATPTRATAQRETILYNFVQNIGNTPPYNLYGGLVFDAAGNLYGTTAQGCLRGGGAAFELSPQAGGWTETTLFCFPEGSFSFAGLIFDNAGNLYGTTSAGGASTHGSVFELTPQAHGSWAENVLASLYAYVPAGGPYAGLIFDSAGNLYGTTLNGGPFQGGTAFRLTPSTNGIWSLHVLYNFGLTNGAAPYGLTMDASGNLYGVTVAGGAYRGGTVFELSPTQSGEWDHKILYNFNCADKGGCSPYGSLIFDHSGNLYGTASTQGFYSNGGTVYELVSNADGGRSEKVLHQFSDNGVDGYRPLAGLASDNSGNLYGTTNQGGAYGVGTVFELSPTPEGAYTERILHSFGDGRQDGYQPYYGSLILDAAGNLYGTTVEGGAYQGGTVFKITP